MFRFVLFATAISLSGFASVDKTEKNCPDGKQHYRATLRHIESGGIGYEDGYTTFEAFLASDPSRWSVTPFLDARGHVFDNGRWAANAGVGLRGLWGNRVYGINSYYDYRSTGRFQSNQIGLGLETLGELFDVRINGYLPVGTKTSSPYDPTFKAFFDHYMRVSQTFQSAMKGANAEFGFHFGHLKSFDFYAAAGPYYFVGQVAQATWGGKARISGTFKDLLTLEISDSYDRTFRNKFQGQIALSYSFGPKSKIKEQGRTCEAANALNSRMLQPVDRQEIIVIDNAKKKSVAIDPATGLPYFFVFVDNTSSSNGTYESRYPTFAQAQSNSSANDIIYVFPGNGTTAGMDAGIALQANQKLFGSGVNQSLQTVQGTISIPAQTSTSPTITNTDIHTELNAITLATNNAISGFIIASAANDAIYGTDPQSLQVSSCTFQDTTTYAIEATFPGDASVSITNNQFLNNENGIFLTLNGTSTILCSENIFEGQTSDFTVPIQITANNNVFTALIENNIFNENTTGGIYCDLTSVIEANLNVRNNTLTNNGSGGRDQLGSSFVISTASTTDTCSVTLQGNTFSGNASDALYLDTAGAFTTLNVTASSNEMSNLGGSALALATPVDSLTLLATNNKITGCINNGIAVIAAGATSTGMITINKNTITDIGNSLNGSSGIAIGQSFSNLNLTTSNNKINGCEGAGIFCFSTGFTNMTANITNNTISNCQNISDNDGSGISLDTYVNLTSTITNNSLSDNAANGIAIGNFTSGNPTVCLTLTGNSNDADPGYFLTNPGMGAFNVSPCNAQSMSINTGSFSTSGVTFVQSCPDATPCSP